MIFKEGEEEEEKKGLFGCALQAGSGYETEADSTTFPNQKVKTKKKSTDFSQYFLNTNC